MLYAKRDQDGVITALFDTPQADASEVVSPNAEEVLQFLLKDASEETSKAYLSRTDLEMVRIIEDLVELLMEKNLIMITDLPPAAQQKLLSRKQLREKISVDQQLLVDDDVLL